MNPDEDTQWNDALRRVGVLPKKKEAEVTENDIVNMLEQTIEKKQNGNEKQLSELDLDELDEFEDEEDERVLQEYRKKRIAEITASLSKSKFGAIREISGIDYVDEVNNAGDGIWVILHLYQPGIVLCSMINQYMNNLAVRFPTVKFIKSIATTCVPNFPNANVPTVFIYFEGKLIHSFIGPSNLRGEKLTADEFEYLLGEKGAIKTDITEDPYRKIKDKLFSDLSETGDWD